MQSKLEWHPSHRRQTLQSAEEHQRETAAGCGACTWDPNLCCYFAIKIPQLTAQLMEGKTSPGIQHSASVSTHSSRIPHLCPSIPDCSETVTVLIDSLCSLSHIVHNFTQFHLLCLSVFSSHPRMVEEQILNAVPGCNISSILHTHAHSYYWVSVTLLWMEGFIWTLSVIQIPFNWTSRIRKTSKWKIKLSHQTFILKSM